MDSTLQALADPRRRALIELLAQGEQPVSALVEHLPIAQSGVSRHLRILREGGLVEVRPQGQQRFYRLRPETLAELERWLAHYRQLWEARFDAFELALEQRRATPAQDDPVEGS